MIQREFRSDTFTLPTRAMREAMKNAVVGDDVVNEDPTVTQLEIMGAKLVGKEAALFVPSGTFGNQCAIGVHISPGQEIIVSETTHIIEHEAGASGALWGAQVRAVVPQHKHFLTPQDIVPRLRTIEDVHHPQTGLIILENALANGTVMSPDDHKAVQQLAQKHGIPIHLDGARVFNAAQYLNVNVQQLTQYVDSVMFCLSKGLGAPIGSLLAGDKKFIKKARWKRKLMGGGMRQVGVIAAPGLVALQEGQDQLKTDHQLAALLEKEISQIDGIEISVAVQTNMVFCKVKNGLSKTTDQLAAYLNQNGFSVYEPSLFGLRIVTSSRVTTDDVMALSNQLRLFSNSHLKI